MTDNHGINPAAHRRLSQTLAQARALGFHSAHGFAVEGLVPNIAPLSTSSAGTSASAPDTSSFMMPMLETLLEKLGV
ncbi:hypothetical protein ABVE12_20880 [Xanthomonas euvesicatoria]|uniref:Uncharacterized protein n=1 Tax=Xanthomonas euvesicatoria pv. euvesicatoria TaxID=2753541 RepID=A0ABS8LI42_XANEU|nr:hypothetical protein [Xanthomonas euvesicatoria]MCC8633424.1 hypothetical protein [Xanthomonas euvesicatoria pv. euvesicatoria]